MAFLSVDVLRLGVLWETLGPLPVTLAITIVLVSFNFSFYLKENYYNIVIIIFVLFFWGLFPWYLRNFNCSTKVKLKHMDAVLIKKNST